MQNGSNRITVADLPENGKFHFYFIISDIHTEHYCKDSFVIFKEHVKLIPPDLRRLIICGDMLDCPHLMGKPADFKRMAKSTDTINELIEKTDEEIEWGNSFLDEFVRLFTKVYFIEGNHDWRYTNWINEYCPMEYAHNFNYTERLRFHQRGIHFIPYPDYLDIGQLTATHGSKHGQYHTKQMYDMVGRNIIYGHVHHSDSKSFVKRGHSCKAWSLPCMSTLAPLYQIKRGENNWTNGYGTFAMRSNGMFNLHIHEIFDKILVLPDGTKIQAY